MEIKKLYQKKINKQRTRNYQTSTSNSIPRNISKRNENMWKKKMKTCAQRKLYTNIYSIITYDSLIGKKWKNKSHVHQ